MGIYIQHRLFQFPVVIGDFSCLINGNEGRKKLQALNVRG
jgi:hypothetical protein